MFCTSCGKQIPENSVCDCHRITPPVSPEQGTQYSNQAPPYPYPPQVMPVDSRKTYSIMAYIPLFWLIGMCVKPEKFDPAVKFHVGQGIIASIACAALSIASTILVLITKAVEKPQIDYSGFLPKYGYPIADTISLIFTLAIVGVTIAWMVIGIINANKNYCKYLPLIGRFSFYK